MNARSKLPRTLSMAALAGLAVLAGCAHQRAENPALSQSGFSPLSETLVLSCV